MTNDLRRELERRIPDSEVPPLALSSIKRRGRRLVWRRRSLQTTAVMGVIVLLSVAWAALGDRLGDSSDRNLAAGGAAIEDGQVATFAITATRDADLRQDGPRIYGYDGIARDPSGWSVTFDAFDCAKQSDGGKCDHQGTVELLVEKKDDRLAIVSASGAVTPQERAALVGYAA